jgi:hypothetical protein
MKTLIMGVLSSFPAANARSHEDQAAHEEQGGSGGKGDGEKGATESRGEGNAEESQKDAIDPRHDPVQGAVGKD